MRPLKFRRWFCLLMLSPLRAAVPFRRHSAKPGLLRFYATASPTPIYPRPIRDPTGISHTKVGGPLRPQLGFRVNPNHGLWAFFRKKDSDENHPEGRYEIIPDTEGKPKVTGTFIVLLSVVWGCNK
jgi:hypothetical protein